MNKHYSDINTSRKYTGFNKITSCLTFFLMMAAMLLLFISCEQSFSLIESLDGPSIINPEAEPGELAIYPTSMGLYVGSSATFTASGGTSPYAFSLVSGVGIISTSGEYSAPLIAGTATIKVTDNIGDTGTASVTIFDIQTNVDYAVSLITDTSATTIGGDPLAGNFTITNIDVTDGTKTVYWDVYLSNNNIYSADDDLIDTGNIAALVSSGSAIINFSGFWPSTAGLYFYIVKTNAVDDIAENVNNSGSSGAIAISGEPADDVNYQISSVPAGGTTILTSGTISESFTIDNIGTDPGTQNIYWTAYVSTNNTLEIGTDSVIDSGNSSSLNGGQTSPAINISGNWVSTAGTYFIILGISAGDDTVSGDNISPSTTFYTVVTLPEITPSSVSLNTGGALTFNGSGGETPYTFSINSTGTGTPSINPVSGAYVAGNSAGTDVIRITDNIGNTADSSVTVTVIVSTVNYDSITVTNAGGTTGGAPLSGTFTFTNNGAGNGTQTVSWEVYISLDNTIGAGDALIDSGTSAALNTGITSSPIAFSGTWPIPVSDTTYYLIAEIGAIDDIVTADNTGNTTVLVTAPVTSDIDYIIQSITNSPATADVNSAISQSFTFRNQGTAPGVFPVEWTAYISNDQIYDGGDTEVASGSVPTLAASTTSGSVDIIGNWPASSGIYYLIIRVTAGDDINPSNDYSTSSSFTINAVAADIDYVVTNVTGNYPTVITGSLIAETFDLSNVGGLNGTQGIDWTAYASINNTLEIGTDIIVGSGTTPYLGLNSGNSYTFNAISGNWPAAGTYYLIIDVSSIDETITGNNTGLNGPYTVKDPPDYIISSTTFQVDGEAGTPLSTFGAFDFSISENAGSDGSQPISWEVFVSEDMALDGSDISIKSGNIAALSAGASSGTISFSDALWPVFGNYYYLIINITSGDDSNSTNNTSFSPKITVPEVYTEGAEDNSDIGITLVPLTQVTDLGIILDNGTLDVGELFRVYGTMDADLQYDTYKIVLSPSATVLDIGVEWITGTDDIDFYLWDENNNQWSSTDGLIDKENSPPFSGLTPGGTYYIGVNFKGTAGGAAYALELQGN